MHVHRNIHPSQGWRLKGYSYRQAGSPAIAHLALAPISSSPFLLVAITTDQTGLCHAAANKALWYHAGFLQQKQAVSKTSTGLSIVSVTQSETACVQNTDLIFENTFPVTFELCCYKISLAECLKYLLDVAESGEVVVLFIRMVILSFFPVITNTALKTE